MLTVKLNITTSDVLSTSTSGDSVGVVATQGVSYWEPDGEGYIKPRGEYLIKEESIDIVNLMLKTDGGLSDNNYTDADAAAVATIANKVDKVEGYGLSENNYTDAEQSAVSTIGNKVDKVEGYGLSENNYTDAEQTAVAGISNKVDKVEGYGLSENNFSDTLESKLNGIEAGANNYTHPASHSPSIISQDASNRFVTDIEKGKWASRAVSFYVDDVLKADTKLCSIVAPFAMTITEVRMAVDTAPTGADLIVDVNKNDVTMYTTQANRPTITAGNTSVTATDPDVTSIAVGDKISIDIDQIGSTVAGENLMVTLICEV